MLRAFGRAFARQPLAVQALAVGAGCWILSFFFAAPSILFYTQPLSGHYDRFFDTFVPQVADPFFRPLQPRGWHGGFLGFRILIPSLAHVLGVGVWGAVGLIWLANALALSVVYVFLRPRVGMRIAALATLGLSMTNFTIASNTTPATLDAVSNLLVASMIVWPTWPVWLLCPLLGLFNDERIVVGLPLALALVLYPRRHSLRDIVNTATPLALAAASALALGWLGREGIATGFIGGRPIVGMIYPPPEPLYGLAYYAAGLFFSFNFFWALPVRAIATAAATDRTAALYWIGLTLYVVLAVLVCARPTDFSRSLACLFPLMLIGVVTLYDFRPGFLERWLPLLVAAMIAIPKLAQYGETIAWVRPLPVSVLEYKMNETLPHFLTCRWRACPARH